MLSSTKVNDINYDVTGKHILELILQCNLDQFKYTYLYKYA